MSSKTSEFYFIGLSMASNSAHSSSVCVINRNKEIVLIDKLYFTDDIKLFFEKSPYVRNSVLMVGLSPDESLLEGKWRIHLKHYKMLDNKFEVNKNNWTNRLNDRLKDFFLELDGQKCKVYRCNSSLIRQSYGLRADYLANSSLDCKNFQLGLKIKYGFRNLPDNLLPIASLEAILFALFAYDISNQKIKTQEISNFCGIKVLNRV